MSETVSITLVTGTVKKEGPNKGNTWEAVKIKVGEWEKMIFVGQDSLIKTNFELKYIKSVLEDEA